MAATDIIQVIEYGISANTPLITIPALLIIVFVGYCLAKKFFDTNYINTSKEARDAQHQLNEELQKEIERLNRKIELLDIENNGLKKQLRQQCQSENQ